MLSRHILLLISLGFSFADPLSQDTFFKTITAFFMASPNGTPFFPQTASPETTTAIQDPFGFGYEGRVAVSRELSRRRAGITAVFSHYESRSKPAPHSVQYQYLLAHGHYTPEELKDHPGRPPRRDQAPETTSADENTDAVEEMRMKEQNEYLARKEDERWKDREARLRRWRASYDDTEAEECSCWYCLGRRPRRYTTDW